MSETVAIRIATVSNVTRILALVFLQVLYIANPVAAAEKTFTKNGLTVSFPRMINISDDDHDELEGELADLEIDHPVDIDENFTRNHLSALWYQWVEPPGKPRPVFTQEEVGRLSRLFRSSLRKVRMGQYIHFEFQSDDGITEGEVFSSVGKIHWRFTRIRGAYYSSEFLGVSKNTWKMIRRVQGQKLRVEKTAVLKIKRENWIVADIKLPPPKPRKRTDVSSPGIRKNLSDKTYPNSITPPAPDVEQKLRTLKNLLNKGLIDQKDYEKKKETLLNEHF